MIPLAVPSIGPREAAYLAECASSGFVSTVGPFVTRFEEGVAEVTGARIGVATASGTTALHLGLIVLGVRPGDLVIAPSFTFIATANAISHAGAMPWLVDIDPASWTLDPVRLEEMLATGTTRSGDDLIHSESGRRVAAIVPVHTLGITADLEPIHDIAARYRLPILADAACAIGLRYRGRPITDFGELSAMSFNGNKTITSGGGGMLLGNDEALLRRARHVSTTARVGRDYDHDEVGYNYRMTNIEAAVGLAQLERLDDLIGRKRAIRRRYDEAFSGINWLSPFPDPGWSDSTCWLSGVIVEPDGPLTAPALIDRLREADIDARPFWKPVHLQKPYAAAPRGPLPVTDGLWHRIVTIPCSVDLSAADQDKVIGVVAAGNA